MNATMKPQQFDEILIDHLAVLAKTGAGKTYMAKGLVEHLLTQKRRVCIVDPKNAWWGLKSSADGKAPGFPIVVFGGPKADVPLLATHGKVLGEAIATGHLSCIICTKGMPEGERIRFLTDFFQTLDMKNSQPLHLVLDEAHMMAPQKPLGEMQRLTHWTSELVSGGRGMGFRIILLSQRPARLNKDVLTQCETLVAMRMTGIQDRDAVKSWIHDQADMETGKEIVASLPGLANGEGWVWAPAKDILKRVKFPLITTYDNSKTSRDAKADDRANLAPVDLSALQEKLGKVRSEIEANDPKALKALVADLQKQLRAKQPAPVPAAPAVDLTYERSVAYNAGWSARLKEEVKERAARNKALETSRSHMERALAALPAVEIATNPASPPAAGAAPPSRALPITPPPAPIRPASALPTISGDLSRSQQRVLDSVAWWGVIGIDQPTAVQVASAARYAVGGNFNNICGSLVSTGHLERRTPGSLSLTSIGAAEANQPDAPASSEGLHEMVAGTLNVPQQKLFRALVEAYPEAITTETLATNSGYAVGGNFNNLAGSLASREILDRPRPGFVRAAEWLFI